MLRIWGDIKITWSRSGSQLGKQIHRDIKTLNSRAKGCEKFSISLAPVSLKKFADTEFEVEFKDERKRPI